MTRSYFENRDISVHTDKRLVTAYPCYQIEIFTLEFVWTTTRDCSGDTRTPVNLQFIVLIFESEYNRKRRIRNRRTAIQTGKLDSKNIKSRNWGI